MANETTSSSISELYTEIIQEAIFTFQETSVMRPLVTTYNITGQGKQVAIPVFPTISASAVAEGSDLANTEVNPTESTITASEVGVNFCHCANYKKFGEFLGHLIEAIRSQALNVIRQGLGLVNVQRLGVEETITHPRVPNYAIA